jgi:aminoglycoside phosphotransferase (APT) family kinase protein
VTQQRQTPVRMPPSASAGDLTDLLDPEAAAALISGAGLRVTSVEPTYLRLKVGRSALVGCTLHGADTDGDVQIDAYARTFAGQEAQTIAAKWSGQRAVSTPLGPGVALLPGERTVLFQFPNDGALRHLAAVSTPARLRRLLVDLPEFDGWRVQARRSSVRPIRWKPERRFVAGAHLRLVHDGRGDRNERELHLRWFPDRRATELSGTARHLGRHGVPVPPQIGVADQGRLQLERSLPGHDGAEALLDGTLEAGAVLDLIAALQAAPPFPSPRNRPRPEPALSARAALELLAAADPELGFLAGTASKSLRPCAEAASVVVHGDLHLHQLLAGGGRLAVVDLERTGIGDPLLDVATVLAHALDLAVRHPARRSLLERFAAELAESALRAAPGRAGVFVHLLRAALIERALLAFRQLEPDWQDHARTLLCRVVGENEGSGWEVLHPRPTGSWTGWRVADDGDVVHGTYEPVTGAFVDRVPESDTALPGLAVWASKGKVLTHRPGRRAVVRAGDRFVKLLRPERVEALLTRHRVLGELARRHPDAVPAVPAVIHAQPSAGIVVQRRLRGHPLHDVLRGQDPEARRWALAQVASMLAGLRRVDVADVSLPPASDGGDPTAWLELVATHRPALVGDYTEVHRALPPATAIRSRPALVHGDLHDRNVYLFGEAVGFIDLDAFGIGDSAIDSGNLAAHIMLRALQRGDDPDIGRAEVDAFLELTADDRATRGWAARTLFRLACLYQFRRRWSRLAPILLQQAAACSNSIGPRDVS